MLVPPFAIGSGVPEYVIDIVPEVVIGDPDIDRKDGTEAATLVTVPPEGVDQYNTPTEPVVNTWPDVPALVGSVKEYPPDDGPYIVHVPVPSIDIYVPNAGVCIVGDEANTTEPDPVAVFVLVPPLEIGSGDVEYSKILLFICRKPAVT